MKGGVILADIKIKKKERGTIKKLDRAKICTQKLKDSVIDIKNKENYDSNEEDEVEYGTNKLAEGTNVIFRKGVNRVSNYGQNLVKTPKKYIEKVEKINVDKKQKLVDKMVKIKVENIKQANRTFETKATKVRNLTIKKDVKLGEQIIERASNITPNTLKAKQELVKRRYKIEKMTQLKDSVKNIKIALKNFVSSIRDIILSTKALLTLLFAGLWIVVIVIVFICMIGLICTSPLGIFFSSEKGVGEKTMSSAVSDINIEFIDKITEIQNNTQHDEFAINSNRAEWKDIISIYAVLVTNGNDQSDVVTLNDKKIELLKKVFWEMNTINSRVENEIREIEITDNKGNVKKQKVIHKVLYIDITNKTIQEMIEHYNFNNKQLEQLSELQKDKYNNLWGNVLYGSSSGSNNIVSVALSQVGNIGGRPYWSWYGFENRVEWCACFVSWCAEQCGYIANGIIPKFASCQNEGIAWFKTCGLWQERGYTPKARRYYIL